MIFNANSGPFVGLRPFESEESLLFFGRQNETLELLQRLHQFHFVAVTGGSGSGKSSIIKAGLIPRLKAGYLVNDSDHWAIVSMKPGQSPMCNLAEAILTQPGLLNGDYTVEALQEKIVREGVDALLNVLKPAWASHTNFFLLVDQFEELFRFSLHENTADKKDEAIDFVNILLQFSTQTDLPIYIVITMRSDFIGDCAQFYGLPEAMNQSQYIVPRLNRIQLETTIEAPVRLFNGKINPALTAKLLNDSQLIKDELPLLQHALMRIWDTEMNVDRNGELDIEDYKRVGGIEKALSNHADEALAGMSATELNLSKKIFQALTAIDDNGRKIRRPIRLSQLLLLTGVDEKTLLAIINRFVEDNRSFLVLNKVENKNDLLIDISHESLIRQWGILDGWVDEEAEAGNMLKRLSESATLYAGKKKDLLSGNELHQFLQWYYLFKPDIVWAQRYSVQYQNNIDYLKDSEEEEKKQRFRKRLNRRILIASLLLIIAIISGFAFVIYRNNIKNREALALNYWKSGQTARTQGNVLAGLHLVANAAVTTNNQGLIKDLFVDGEAYLPHTSLENIFPQNAIINTVVFSPDDKYILIAGNDGSARIIDKITGQQIGNEMNHSMPVIGAAFSYDGKWILTFTNKAVFIWDRATLKQVHIFKDEDDVKSAVFSPDARLVLTGTANNYAKVWQIDTEKKIDSFEHVAAVSSAVFSIDGTKLLTTCSDFTPHLWDIATKKEINFSDSSIHKNESIILGVSYSNDGTKILTRCSDSTCRVWDITGKQLASFKHDDDIKDAVFSPDGKWVLTASRNKAARLWDITTQHQVGPVMKHDGPIYSVAFSADGNEILTAGWDKMIRLWKMESVPVDNKQIVFKQKGIITSGVFSSDGKRILTAGYDSTARVWNVESGKQLNSLKHNGKVNSAIFSADGTKVLTASDDSTVRVWNAGNGEQIGYIKLDEKVNAATFSSDAKSILTVSANGDLSAVDVWDAEIEASSVPVRSFKLPYYIFNVNVSADSKTILIAGDSSAYIIDAFTGKQLMSFQHEDEVTDASFSPNEKNIVTASRDLTARVWNIFNGKQIGPSMNHNGAVNTAFFSADGKWIVTAGWDMEAHIWNASTFKEMGGAKEQGAPVTSAVFSPGAKFILITAYDSTARLWPILADLDLPVDLFKLQAQVITGVEYNVVTGETECIPAKEWYSLKEKYNNQAKEHYKICKYSNYNFWGRFNNGEAKE